MRGGFAIWSLVEGEGDHPVAEQKKGFDSCAALLVRSAGDEYSTLVAAKTLTLLKTGDHLGTRLPRYRASHHCPLMCVRH